MGHAKRETVEYDRKPAVRIADTTFVRSLGRVRRPAVNGQGRSNGAGGFIQGAAAHNLRQLVLLRNISIVAQILTIVSASRYLAVSLPIRAMLSVSGVLALVNLATFWRLQFALPVTDIEVFGQILVDIGGLGGLLYFSGGASNPFVGLFLRSEERRVGKE